MKFVNYLVTCNGRRYAGFNRLTDAINWASSQSKDSDSPWSVTERPNVGELTVAVYIHGQQTLTQRGHQLIANGTP